MRSVAKKKSEPKEIEKELLPIFEGFIKDKYNKLGLLRETWNTLYEELGRIPTNNEIAQRCGISPYKQIQMYKKIAIGDDEATKFRMFFYEILHTITSSAIGGNMSAVKLYNEMVMGYNGTQQGEDGSDTFTLIME